MVNKLITIICLLFSTLAFSQDKQALRYTDEKVYLKFSFSQTKINNGDYFAGNQDTLKTIPYQGGVIPVPDDTIERLYIFKSGFIVDQRLKGVDLAIMIGMIDFPCYVFLNKQIIGRIGSFKETYTSQIHNSHFFILPSPLLHFGDQPNELVLQGYSRFNETRPLDKIFISSFLTVSDWTFWRNFWSIDIVKASMFVCVLLFFYFFFRFILSKDRSETKYLYFAFICLFFTLSYSNISFCYDTAYQLLTIKLTRVGMLFCTLFLLLFTMNFTKLLYKKLWLTLLLFSCSMIFSISIILQKNLTDVEKVFVYFPIITIFPYFFLSAIIIIIALIRKPDLYNIVYSIGFSIVATCFFIDAYNFVLHKVPYSWMVPHGYTLFILGIFYILAYEQNQAYRLSVTRARELQFMKDNLELIVDERTQKINQQKEEILAQIDEIEAQKDEISSQKTIIENKNKNLTDSIQYAHRIQLAVLPKEEYIEQLQLPYFILFKPKDIVSGDFYFFKQIGHKIIIAAADCTGHGVPGALMSMLGIALLNEITQRTEITTPAKTLNTLLELLRTALQQTGKSGEQHEGIDIAYCILDIKNMKLQFAGANNPLCLIRDEADESLSNHSKLIVIPGDRLPIGGHHNDNHDFTHHEIPVQKGDMLYLFSDGYISQFGGKKGKTLKTKPFLELLQSIHDKPVSGQKEILENTLNIWQEKHEQVDDILVIGVRI